MNVKMCGWAKSSTNKTINQFPDECRKKKCKGFFEEGIKPACEDFMPVPKSLEKEFKEYFEKLHLEQ